MPIKSLGYGRRGPKGTDGTNGTNGTNGSNATATPLGNAIPQPWGTATAGVSTNAARDDHTHPKMGSVLQFIGTVLVGETLLVSLSAGVKRMTLALSGVLTSDRLVAVPNGIPTTGCEVINAYPASANNVSIGYQVPLLGIGASYSIPVAVYRVAS